MKVLLSSVHQKVNDRLKVLWFFEPKKIAHSVSQKCSFTTTWINFTSLTEISHTLDKALFSPSHTQCVSVQSTVPSIGGQSLSTSKSKHKCTSVLHDEKSINQIWNSTWIGWKTQSKKVLDSKQINYMHSCYRSVASKQDTVLSVWTWSASVFFRMIDKSQY